MIIYVKIILVVIFRTIEGENESKYWIFWKVAIHGLGYDQGKQCGGFANEGQCKQFQSIVDS